MENLQSPALTAEASRERLTGYLEKCDALLAAIVREAESEHLPALRIQYTLAAARLMRTSTGIVTALDRDATAKKSKTIHGGPGQEGAQN